MDNNNPQDPNSNNPFAPQNPTPPATGNPPIPLPTDPIATFQTTPPAANPWDQSMSSGSSNISAPAQETPQAPWPSSSASMPEPAAVAPSLDPTLPSQSIPAPAETNPFLQPQAPLPDPLGQPPADTPPLSMPEAPTLTTPQGQLPQDPLNTAFNPAEAAPAANPFAQPQAPEATPMGPVPEAPSVSTPPSTNDQNQDMPTSSSTGPLDLSTLQANPVNPMPMGSTEQPGNPPASANPLPEVGPTENAPTDLSHLIAGDEQNPSPGVYNPPIATDQNPYLNSTPAQTQPGEGVPPPGKHLNLTKILLVAGIPIILIVAALSAYLILGIGKPASKTNQTSLPIEQQAPLTNPPQQIVAPSPVTVPNPNMIPNPSIAPVIASPSAAPVSALEQLKARQQSATSSPTTN